MQSLTRGVSIVSRVGVRGVSTTPVSSSVLRTWGTVGANLNKVPNGVPALQSTFGPGKHAFTHLNAASDSTSNGAAYVVFGLCTIIAVKGVADVLLGSGKKPE